MLEKDIERLLVRRVKEMGGKAYKFVSPGNAGVPDRIVILPTGHVIFIELKTDTGSLTKLQKIQIKKLLKLNQQVFILYGKSEVERFLDNCREVLNGAEF